jgi:hypothetical protein
MTNRFDTLRELTEVEALEASSIHPYFGRWYGVWVDDGWTTDEITAWFPLTKWISKLPDYAAPLRAYGWTPEQIKALCEGATLIDPQAPENPVIFGWDPTAVVSWDGTGVRPNQTGGERSRAMAYAVVSSFLATWHQFWADGALRSRAESIHQAHRATGIDQVAIGKALGLTKQRIGAILKDPTSRPPVAGGAWSEEVHLMGCDPCPETADSATHKTSCDTPS